MSQHGCPERLSNRSKGFQEESSGQATMEVLVETLTGTAFEMTVSPSDTIFAIKSKIFRVEGIPVSQQHLVYNLKELDDGASLRALGISDGARLRLVLGMRGGPISTRRLPPPPSDISGELERLLSNNRESGSWSGRGGGGSSGAGAGGGAGCKVTVLVFRDGERVNMLRVRENKDGTLQPLDHAHYSSSLTHLPEQQSVDTAGGARDNAVTMNKMLELRRRMEALSVRRCTDTKAEIQKTRSEETLSVPSLLDDGAYRAYTPYSEADDACAPLCDQHYTRYDYECAFADRYTLLPPIGSRTESEQSVEVPSSTRLGLGRFGSSSHLAAPPAPPAPPARLSASTSHLEALRRAPPLSRHRPRDLLHLSEPRLERLAPTPVEQPPPPKKRRVRCAQCRKRLSPGAVHRCRCGAQFCAPHRYAEVHGCAYDYKALLATPPPVRPPKLPEI